MVFTSHREKVRLAKNHKCKLWFRRNWNRDLTVDVPTVDYSAKGASLLPEPDAPISRIHREIRQAVYDYQVSSFKTYAFDMMIVPYQPTRENAHDNRLDPLKLAHFRSQAFRLTSQGHSDNFLVIARLDRDHNVEVCFLPEHLNYRHYKFMPITDWFYTLPIPNNPADMVYLEPSTAISVRNNHKDDWYRANGKTFNFLALPLELRKKIYSFCTGPQVEPYPAHTYRRKSGNYVKSLINTALMSVSKDVLSEYSKQVYEELPFILNCRSLVAEMGKSNGRCQFDRVKHVVLDMNYGELLSIFGMHILVPRDQSTGHSRLSLLETFYADEGQAREAFHGRRLRSLEIVIPDPIQLEVYGGASFICSRKFVDLVIKAMWPYIEGQPIKFSGFIQDDQKAYFEDMAHAAYLQRQQLDAAGFHDEHVNTLFDDGRWVGPDVESLAVVHWFGVNQDVRDANPGLENPAREKVTPHSCGSRWAIEVEFPVLCNCERSCLYAAITLFPDDDSSEVDNMFNSIFDEVEEAPDTASDTITEDDPDNETPVGSESELTDGATSLYCASDNFSTMTVNGSEDSFSDDSTSQSGVSSGSETIVEDPDSQTSISSGSETLTNDSDSETSGSSGSETVFDDSESQSDTSDGSETASDSDSDFTDGAISLYDPLYPNAEQSAGESGADNTTPNVDAALDPNYWAPPPYHEEAYESLDIFERRFGPEYHEEVYATLDLFEIQLMARAANMGADDLIPVEAPPARNSREFHWSFERDDELCPEWLALRPAVRQVEPRVRETAAQRRARLEELRKSFVLERA